MKDRSLLQVILTEYSRLKAGEGHEDICSSKVPLVWSMEGGPEGDKTWVMKDS